MFLNKRRTFLEKARCRGPQAMCTAEQAGAGTFFVFKTCLVKTKVCFCQKTDNIGNYSRFVRNIWQCMVLCTYLRTNSCDGGASRG